MMKDFATNSRPGEALTALERRLLNDFQRDFPLCPLPFAALAERLGVDEAAVIETLQSLRRRGYVSRVGAVVTPHRAGWSSLAAMSVPEARLEEVAALVSSYPEVNHNYERTHAINLWFVVAAADEAAVERVLQDIAERTGLEVLDLPLLESYRLDLGFPLQWA